MVHHPVHVPLPLAQQQVAVKPPGVVVPQAVVHPQDLSAVQAVEHVLVRQQQNVGVLPGIVEDVTRPDLPPHGGQIHHQYAGVVVGLRLIVLQPQPVHRVCDARQQPGVGGGGHQVSLQVRIIQGPDGIDYQNVRVQIQHPVQRTRQQLRRQQPVVHGPGPVPGHRRVGEQVRRHLQRVDAPPTGAELLQCRPVLRHQAVSDGVNLKGLARIIPQQRAQHHPQGREIVAVQCHQNVHVVKPSDPLVRAVSR